MNMIWPESVLVLDEDWGCELLPDDKAPGHGPENEPRTPLQYATNEFRVGAEGYPDPDNYPHRNGINMMLQIWDYRFRCLQSIMWKYPHTYSLIDVYNAAWVSCGYFENQSDKAIELSGKRFSPIPDPGDTELPVDQHERPYSSDPSAGSAPPKAKRKKARKKVTA